MALKILLLAAVLFSAAAVYFLPDWQSSLPESLPPPLAPLIQSSPSPPVSSELPPKAAPKDAPTPSAPPKKATEPPLLPPLPSFVPRPPAVVEQPLNMRTIVGLRCYFKDKNTGEVKALDKGSGVLVSAEGHILTARHVIDLEFAQGETRYAFEYCEVGQPPALTAPDAATIRAVNPSFNLPHPFAYIATLAFSPAKTGLSDWEEQNLDFALLKISGLRPDAALFDIKMPEHFDYVPLLLSGDHPAPGDELITFGFPAEGGFDPTIFLLKGSVGTVEKIHLGDQKFKNEPFLIEARLEGRGGRSGSPVFWRGYVAGVFVSVLTDNFTISHSIHIRPIWQALKAAGALR